MLYFITNKIRLKLQSAKTQCWTRLAESFGLLSASREPATSFRIQDFIMAGGSLGLINYDYPVQKLEKISIYDDPTIQKT